MRRGSLEADQALLLVTDGIGDFLGDGSSPLGGFLQDRLLACAGLPDFLRAVGAWAYQMDDDRTAVLVRGKEASAA